jgi:SAM-dependent methyltransferase
VFAAVGPDNDYSAEASTEAMRAYWDSKARENAMFYIHSELDFRDPDAAEFWQSGAHNLDATLGPFDRQFAGTERVLEIGCGMGRITRAIAGRAASVVGVDVSDEMVKRAREALADVANVQIELGNGQDLSAFADAEFDACYSFIVFQHIPDPAVTCGYIAEIGRVLRPGGWAVFQISDQASIHERSSYTRGLQLRRRASRLLRRGPRGCLEPQWLGSAVPRADLMAALERGGLDLLGTVGDGTQFCLVHVSRRS